MNGWDVFTWICSGALGLSAVLIFSYFLRDARGIIQGQRSETDEADDRKSREQG